MSNKIPIGKLSGITVEELYNGSFNSGILTLPKSVNDFKMLYIEWHTGNGIERITQLICRNLDTGNYHLEGASVSYMIAFGWGTDGRYSNFNFSADGISLEITSNNSGYINKIYGIK